MKRLIVDASIALKWFMPEAHSDAARRLLHEDYELLAPDLMLSEFTYALWKKASRDEITSATARSILRDFQRFPVKILSSEDLLLDAWDIAERFKASLYDAIYLALATHQGCVLVTADQKLYDMHTQDALTAHLLWVENLP